MIFFIFDQMVYNIVCVKKNYVTASKSTNCPEFVI